MIEKVQESHLYMWLKEKDSKFLSKLDEVIEYANTMLPQINNVFASYTVHGVKYSINVMEYMYALIVDINKLSELEVALLIYSALLHDIGMVANEEEIKEIKNDRAILGERKYSKVLEKYGDETTALQECIRPVHGKRARDYIEKKMNERLFLIPESTNISFKSELAQICMSHNEDFEWIKKNLRNDEKKGHFDLNAQYISVLLRISDYLDIDEQRAPLYLYKYLNPKEFSDLEWKQHFVIENYDKIRRNSKTNALEIFFQGTSQDPSVHRKLLKYFDAINGELKNAVDLCESFVDEKYLLPLKTNVVNKIQTEGFSFSDLRLSLDYNAVTNLLMGEHIYGDRKYGLRELIQNSIDACKTMEESSTKMEKFRYQKYNPYISVILDKDRKKVMVMDNGSGMSIDILKKYFLNVGISYYASDDYKLQDRKYSPIGHYGIGFLACFMLSDKVEVNTVYYNEQKMNRISFERNSEYICLTYEDSPSRSQGTEIILDYDQCLSVFDNSIEKLVSFIENNFLDCGIPIKVSTMENGESSLVECNVKNIEKIIAENMCLSEYLNGIEAFIDCGYKQINFAEHLSDINGCESYCYNESKNWLDEENIPIKNCVEDGKIIFLNIPIITRNEEDKFLKAYDVLEDFQEALDRIEDYEYINIWGDEKEFGDCRFVIGESKQSIIGKYTLVEFRNQFHHGSYTPADLEIIIKGVITGESDAVLPYNEDNTFGDRYSWIKTDTCYVKNVLLRELKLKIPYLVDGVILKGVVINIFNQEFIPNVSRNNISELQQRELSYAIGKAIHLWIRDHAKLSAEQKALLDVFIETKYKETNYCLK